MVREEVNEIVYEDDSSDYDDSEDGSNYKSVGTQLMNNESIGLSQPSPEASYEHADPEDLSAAGLAIYAAATSEKQDALDSGLVTIAEVRR